MRGCNRLQLLNILSMLENTLNDVMVSVDKFIIYCQIFQTRFNDLWFEVLLCKISLAVDVSAVLVVSFFCCLFQLAFIHTVSVYSYSMDRFAWFNIEISNI